MGKALAEAAIRAGHQVTLILGPIFIEMPLAVVARINVETAQQMFDAVTREFANNDLIIMAAAVSDFRPKSAHGDKLARQGALTLELEPTADIIGAVGNQKLPHQRTIGFSLEADDGLERARRKMLEKNLDLIVFNPLRTLDAATIDATFLYPDGRSEKVSSRPKAELADILLQRAADLFATMA